MSGIRPGLWAILRRVFPVAEQRAAWAEERHHRGRVRSAPRHRLRTRLDHWGASQGVEMGEHRSNTAPKGHAFNGNSQG